MLEYQNQQNIIFGIDFASKYCFNAYKENSVKDIFVKLTTLIDDMKNEQQV